MPQIGEIKTSRELGYATRGHRFIWAACKKCGKERWVQIRKSSVFPEMLQLASKLCKSCAGKNKLCHKGKRLRIGDGEGYIRILVNKDDFFYPMVNKDGRVLEHRLVMAKSLNRCLLPWEIVHHRNGIKDDNSLENLVLISGRGNHNTLLNKTIINLQRENAELREKLAHYEGDGN